MAEGWAKHLFGDSISACSAGIDPQGLNPLAVRAMAEAGVDISMHTSKRIDDCDPGSLDLVITVCGHASENCPVFPGTARVVDQGFDDPPALAASAKTDEEALPHYLRIRDEIRAFIGSSLEALISANTNKMRESH